MFDAGGDTFVLKKSCSITMRLWTFLLRQEMKRN
jgi:hypothetical protein